MYQINRNSKRKAELPVPKQIRSKIIFQVQKFQELANTLNLNADESVKLKSIISSKTLRRIREYHNVICGT
jgi:hypothetical protein